MYRAYFNSTYFNIIELPTISDSSRETSFSELVIDFRGKTDSDLPVQFQEVLIYRDSTHIATGYVDTVDFPEFEFEDQPFKLTISLLSPHTYTSKRTISLTIDTIALNVAILDVIAPLLSDGFILEENTVSTKLVSEIFQAETVEKVLNYLGNKFKFVWYIDKDKKIYLKDIDELVGQAPIVSVIDSDRCYLKSIKPTKTVLDYANKLVIKNAILLGGQTLLPNNTDLINGTTYTFTYPISISENTAFRLDRANDIMNYTYSFSLYATTAGVIDIEIDLDNKTITYNSKIGFLGTDDNDVTKYVLLQRSATDPTKITGFKWNAAADVAESAFSQSGLFPVIATFIDPIQVSNIKDKVNASGIIERLVDANLKYFSYDELLEYATNLFTANNVLTNEVDCVFKGRVDDTDFMTIANTLQITKVFNVHLPNFLITGNFIITDRELTSTMQTLELRIKGRNYNLTEDFNDLYRSPMEQLNENDLTNQITVLYNQDNKTVMNKEIIVNGVVVNNE